MDSFFDDSINSSFGFGLVSNQNSTLNDTNGENFGTTFNKVLRWTGCSEELLPSISEVEAFFQNDDEVKVLFSQLSESNVVTSEELNVFCNKDNKINDEEIERFFNEDLKEVNSKLVLSEKSIDQITAEATKLQALNNSTNFLIKNLQSESKQKEKSVSYLKETSTALEGQIKSKIETTQVLKEDMMQHFKQLVDIASEFQVDPETNCLQVPITWGAASADCFLNLLIDMNEEIIDVLNILYNKFQPVAAFCLKLIRAIHNEENSTQNVQIKLSFLNAALEYLKNLEFFNRLFDLSQNLHKYSSILLALQCNRRNKNIIVSTLIGNIIPIISSAIVNFTDMKQKNFTVLNNENLVDKISKFSEILTSSSNLTTTDDLIQNMQNFYEEFDEASIKLDKHFETINTVLVEKTLMIENYLKKMHSKSCNIQEEINDVLKIFDEIKSSELALSSLQQSMQDENVETENVGKFSDLTLLMFTNSELVIDTIEKMEEKIKILEKAATFKQ